MGSDELKILLLGVPHSYARSLRALAKRAEIQSLPAEADVSSLPRGLHALCVIGADGDPLGPEDRLRILRKSLRGVPVVVLGERLDVDSVVRLMRAGVADVIGLPAPPQDAAARALSHLSDPRSSPRSRRVVGHSPLIQKLRQDARAVAATRSTVLLTGETGTGKGLVAQTIHDLSRSAQYPFIHVDCSSLAGSVIESELFGHERGAFTGAVARRAGRFELAGSGTVFLDEISELAPSLQVKLLRVLQDRTFERVGGTRTLRTDARIIAATNRNLGELIRAGRFRTDLYFRLNVFELELPPLRDRLEDLPLLVRAGLEELGHRMEMDLPAIEDAFYGKLSEHHWPGNVRELFNLLERLMVSAPERVWDARTLEGCLADGVAWSRASGGDLHVEGLPLLPDPRSEFEERERALLVETLDTHRWNVSAAARDLGISRGALRYRMRRAGLTNGS